MTQALAYVDVWSRAWRAGRLALVLLAVSRGWHRGAALMVLGRRRGLMLEAAFRRGRLLPRAGWRLL